MCSENKRLKEIQKILGFKSQQLFADALNIKQGTLSDIYRAKNGIRVSDAIKRRLDKEFSINIEWLETGAGTILQENADQAGRKSNPRQLEFDFNKWLQIEEVKANSFKQITEANQLMAESNKILAQSTTEVIKEIKDTLVRLEQQIAKKRVDAQQEDNVISAAASDFNSEK